jgi:hypothetical protein
LLVHDRQHHACRHPFVQQTFTRKHRLPHPSAARECSPSYRWCLMDEGFLPSPRREEGANQDSQPTSNTRIGKKTRPPSAKWLNPPSFPQDQKT